MPDMQRDSSGENDIMEATTQRIELAKQAAAIMADQELDFDEACSAVVGLIQDTTGGAPLALQRDIVPIESLAPEGKPFSCSESPSGLHCADHRYRLTGLLHELRCCWCKEKIEVKITQLHVITEGHGPSSGYEEDRFAMPEGWEEGA